MDGCEERFSLFASFEPRNNALYGTRVLDSSDRKKQLKTSLVSHAVDTVFHFMKLSFFHPIYFHFWTTSAEHRSRAVCTMLSIHVFFCCGLWQKYVYHVNAPRPFPQRKDTRIPDSLHLELSHCIIDYKNHLRMLQLLNNRSTLGQHALLCSIFQELKCRLGTIWRRMSKAPIWKPTCCQSRDGGCGINRDPSVWTMFLQKGRQL